MKRREFTQSLALMSLLAPGLSLSPGSLRANRIKKVGIQLFSLPKMLEQDFRQCVAFLSALGYREVELFGPYPFSAESAKASWKAIAPQLGFSGSGYFGREASELRQIFREHDISIPSVHTDLETLQSNMGQLGAAGRDLGFSYVGIAYIPAAMRNTLDDYKRIADTFNRIGEAAKKEGLRFFYHNHGYGLQEVGEVVPLKLLLEQTDPELVFFEMDIYWTTAGGADPIEYLKAYPGRYRLLHLKDMRESKRFSGDGGDPSQWIELFPYMVSAGKGILNIEAIVEQAVAAGVQHFFVEQDMVADPEVSLRDSIAYLSKL
jgi:sugar phosphate isomerase/epimerase